MSAGTRPRSRRRHLKRLRSCSLRGLLGAREGGFGCSRLLGLGGRTDLKPSARTWPSSARKYRPKSWRLSPASTPSVRSSSATKTPPPSPDQPPSLRNSPVVGVVRCHRPRSQPPQTIGPSTAPARGPVTRRALRACPSPASPAALPGLDSRVAGAAMSGNARNQT